MSLYHRVMQRVEGLKAGSPSMLGQLMNMLKLTPNLHQVGSIDAEQIHLDTATSQWYTLRVANHNEGPPEQATWCPPNVKANRTPKSWALIVGTRDGLDGTYNSAGDADFKRDAHVKRYLFGSVRWATATADSVGMTVEATDNEFGCQIEGGIQISGGGTILENDDVAYVIQWDGTPVTFGGGSGGSYLLKVGTANANAREGDTTVEVTNNTTSAVHTVNLANTPAGKTPNINAGATVVYGLADDGDYWCVSDYTDDPVGTVKGWRLPLAANRPAATASSPAGWLDGGTGSWQWHAESASRNVPNCGDDVPFQNIGDTGGTVSHDHDPHVFTIPAHQLTFTQTTVVSSVSFNSGTCELSGVTTDICVLSGVA